MTLTNRFLTFLLIVLFIVLTGFTLTLYLLARSYLHREVDDRLNTAIVTLTASIEIKKPHLLEWEPEKHHLTTGVGFGEEHVRWIVRDRENRLVDCSKNLENLPDFAVALAGTEIASESDDWPTNLHAADATMWRLRSVRVRPPVQEPDAVLRSSHKRIYS
jgi:hypothetical protein